jgi:hypothetical protein
VFSAQQLTNVLREKVEQGVEIRLVPILGLRAAPSQKCSIYWGSVFLITPAKWNQAITRWNWA